MFAIIESAFSPRVNNGAMVLRIRQLRQEKGWSQAELGERAGLAPSYVSELERGLKPINTRRLHQIAKALGIEAHELISPQANPLLQELIEIWPSLTQRDQRRLVRLALSFPDPDADDEREPGPE